MTIQASTWLGRRKWIIAAVGLPVLIALWWAFRPEKLWINEKVNEAAPFDTSGGPQPILTGRFEGQTEATSGRATIYKQPGSEYLRLSDFAMPNGEDVHVELARSGDQNPSQAASDRIDLGRLKSNQGDQNYDLPAGADLSKYDAAVIYSEQSHQVLGQAKLEPF
jgi:hypothetical protein